MHVFQRLVTFLVVGVLSLAGLTRAKADLPPQFWSNFTKITSFTSDGVTPVTLTLAGEYDDESVIDDQPSPGGPKGDQPLAASIKGPGVLVYPSGTTPPFANSFPPLHTDSTGHVTSDNTEADWNPAITAAVAGPYWPAGFSRPGPSPGPGTVTVKVLPAGSYDVWGQFGTGSIPAYVGPAERFPYITVTLISATGNVTTPPGNPTPTYTTPTVTLSVPADLAVAGTGTNGKLAVTRTGGNTTQSLTVTIEAGVPSNALTSTAFPMPGYADYSLAYATDAVTSGGSISPDPSTGKFTVVIPANALAIKLIVTGNLVTPPPNPPTRPAVFELVPSANYTIGN